MDVLPAHFGFFRLFGIWYERPDQRWTLKLAYRSFVFLVVLQMTTIQIVDLLIAARRDVEEFSEVLFLTLTFVAFGYKLARFVLAQGTVADLLHLFRAEVCCPKCPEEQDILGKYGRIARRAFSVRMFLAMSSTFAFFVGPLLSNQPKLLFGSSFFQTSSSLGFASVYTYQVISGLTAILLDVCLDSTSCAFIILACGQLALCCRRILTSHDGSGDGHTIRHYVGHHVHVQLIVHKIQETFIPIILTIFASGLCTLCTSTFQLVQKCNTIDDYLFVLSYLAVLLLQTYYFCWFGNELQLKSEIVSKAIYSGDWTDMKPSERRNYWFMMFMGQNKLVISYHGQCCLTLQTFIWMIKTSYGAFNLLQKVSTNQ